MSQRSPNLETLRLSLEILRRIPRGRKISAPELLQQIQDAGFQRDLRTIQRQLDELSQAFDIERDDRSKPYGYRYKEKASIFAMGQLTAQESLLLMLAQEHLRNLLPRKLLASMDGFFEQARRNLHTAEGQALEKEWPSKIRVVATSQPLLPPAIKPAVLDAVSEALYNNHWLEVDYQNARGKKTQARVMPLGLAQQGANLYLVCRFDGYKEERTLALHRMQQARKLDLPFERPRFDLKKFDDEGRFGFGAGQKIRLHFAIREAEGRHLLETRLSADQQVADMGKGWLHISATVVDSDMLDWWLRGFGKAVQNVRKDAVAEIS